jgi:hypothetical protein
MAQRKYCDHVTEGMPHAEALLGCLTPDTDKGFEWCIEIESGLQSVRAILVVKLDTFVQAVERKDHGREIGSMLVFPHVAIHVTRRNRAQFASVDPWIVRLDDFLVLCEILGMLDRAKGITTTGMRIIPQDVLQHVLPRNIRPLIPH